MHIRVALCSFICLMLQLPVWCAGAADLAEGIQLYNSGKYAQAIDLLNKAQSNQAVAARALYYRALAELKLGRNTAGADTMRALIAVSPNTAEARMARRYLLSLAGTQASTTNAMLPKYVKIPYREGRDGWLHVTATVNSHKVDMVWDTGASNCSIPLRYLDSLPENAKATSVETPTGPQQAYLAPVEIECGDLKRFALTSIMEGTAVVGESFFHDYRVDFDKKQHLMYLDYVGIMRGGATKPAAGSKFQLPFEREAGILLVEISVNGDKTKAYFDTGCAAKGIAMSRTMSNNYPRTVDLSLGPITRKAVKVTVADGLTRPLVGPAIFGDRGYKIDPARQVIDFDYVQE